MVDTSFIKKFYLDDGRFRHNVATLVEIRIYDEIFHGGFEVVKYSNTFSISS